MTDRDKIANVLNSTEISQELSKEDIYKFADALIAAGIGDVSELKNHRVVSVLRSIKPYWFYLICEGKKPIEVGKTAPTAEYWDKITYLYCSKDMKSFNLIPKEHREKYRKYIGKVGAMFVCDKVIKTCGWRLRGNTGWCAKRTEAEEKFPTSACLTIDEIVEYAGGEGREVSGWHISDLKIYDKPRELSEFRKPCKRNYECENPTMCEYLEYDALYDGAFNCSCIRPHITRPPQSWQYIKPLDK